MKLTVKTTILQSLLEKAIKGANNNKLIPLTQFMCVNKTGKKLILTTTFNMSTYLYSIANNIEGDDFYIVVEADKFYRIISKMTCENITLELKSNTLEIVGNGRYSLELPMDVISEDGEIIKFPDPYRDIHPQDTEDIPFNHKIQYSDIITILNTVKTSLAVTMEMPCLVNYYVGNSVVTSDRENVSSYNKNLMDSEEMLIAPEVMNLMSLLGQEEIDVYSTDEFILFVTDETILYTLKTDGLEDYPIDKLSEYIEQKFKYSCTLNKNNILALLDRMSLFVSEYDNGAITLSFGKKELTVSNSNSSSDEAVEYETPIKALKSDFKCNIDIRVLTNHIKSCQLDNIEFQFENDFSIKIVDGDIVKMLCLLSE